MKRALLVCFLGGVLATSNGCCAWRYGDCGPCGPCGVADCGPCDPPCAGPACGPGCGPFGVRSAVTYEPGDCCDAAPCGGCEPCGFSGPCRPWGPFFWFPGLFGRGCAGCGERYWGVWSDCVGPDPCDCWGNWTGSPGCGCGCGGPNRVVGGPIYAGTGPTPSTQITQTISPRPQYTARPQQYAPQQHASPQSISRPQQYAAGARNAARPQYVQRARQYTGQAQYASQPRPAPRVISEADQVFDPTITDPAWQTTQQPTRAMTR